MDKNTYISYIAHNLSNLKSDCLALSNHALDSACTYNVTKSRLSSFNKRLSQVTDSEGRAIWVRNLEVDD